MARFTYRNLLANVLRRRTPQIDCLWSDGINVSELRHGKEEKSQG
jgi:hypothetical protein